MQTHAPGASWDAIDGPAHLVQLYRGDDFLIGAAQRYVGAALGAGDAAVVLATEPHRRALEERLRGDGIDLDAARAEGAYVPLDAEASAARLLVGGRPDRARFEALVVGALEAAAGGGKRRVRAFGEMVALLWADGRRDATLRLEELWEELARQLPFTLVCAYPLAAFRSDAEARAFLPICALHDEVLPSEAYGGLARPAERRRAVALLEQRASALAAERAAAAQRRDELLALLGHELRNPLAALQSALASASRGAEGRERALEIAERQAKQLGALVDGLLDAARAGSARLELRRERVSLTAIAARAAAAIGALAARRGHRITLAAFDADLLVDADPQRLDEVVVGLLSNAVRYSEPGAPIALELGQHGEEAWLRVRDSGAGIEPELLDRVFDPFVQGERPLDRAGSGLGIGLAVAHALVERHGGRLEARSEGRGRGAEFLLSLPLAPRRAASARPARVLLVEDNRDVAESLMRLLEGMGHSVRVAHDGLAGLELLRSEPAEVALIDIGLPGIDGYELARRARREPGGARLVLVAVTGYGEAADRARALEAGFDHHFVKPIDLEALRAVLAELAAPSEASLPS